jgi:hypothetical protein
VATIGGAFDVSLLDVVRGLGLSTENKLIAQLRQHIPPAEARNPIELRLVVTNADGEPVSPEGPSATTFEHVVDLTGEDFDTAASLERVFAATAASSALPGLFAPVPLPIGNGTFPGLDGGLVDDTPLGLALSGAPDVVRAFVIAPFPSVRTTPADLRGLGLASRVLDLTIDERLVRDLRGAARVNRVLALLPSVLPDAAQRAAVLEAIGWTGRRVVQIVEIRPAAELPGDAFSGFTSRELRQQYVQAGIDAAQAALARGAGLSNGNPSTGV